MFWALGADRVLGFGAGLDEKVRFQGFRGFASVFGCGGFGASGGLWGFIGWFKGSGMQKRVGMFPLMLTVLIRGTSPV